MLLKIDKAIQDTEDHREYFREVTDHESVTPLQQRCQVINTRSFEEAARMTSTTGVGSIAILNDPNLARPESTPDISFINNFECNQEGEIGPGRVTASCAQVSQGFS